MNRPAGPSEQRGEAKAPLTLVPQPAPARPRGRKAWVIGALLGLAVIAAVGAAWWFTSAGGNVRYSTAAVTRGAVTRTVTATGTVNPVLTVIVGSYVSGVIQELACDCNTQVKVGQIHLSIRGRCRFRSLRFSLNCPSA